MPTIDRLSGVRITVPAGVSVAATAVPRRRLLAGAAAPARQPLPPPPKCRMRLCNC